MYNNYYNNFVTSNLCRVVAYFENLEKIVCCFRIGTSKG